MVKNYLRLSFRSILSQGHQSVLSATGLSVAMSCGILILLYTQWELSFDRYHEHAAEIYRVETIQPGDYSYMGNDKFAVTPAPLKSALVNDIPEIKSATKCKFISHTLEYNSSLFSGNIFLYADTDFLRIFTFPVLLGNPEVSLREPFSLFLTEKMAVKYFGKEDPVGKILKADNQYLFTVRGVLKDVPENSHFKFDFLTGFETFYALRGGKGMVERWDNFSYITYFQINEHASLAEITGKLNTFTEKYLSDEPFFKDRQWVPKPLTAIHLGGSSNFEPVKSSDIRYLYLTSAIGFFILLIACFNYSNMATARSYNRARETAILKVFGSSKSNLIMQFITEALLLSFAGLIMALVIVLAVLPGVSDLTDRPLNFRMIYEFSTLIKIVALMMLTGLLAGIYPSFHLSSVSPLRLLKEDFKRIGGSARSLQIKNILVICQYIISFVALVCTLTLLIQFNFIRNRDSGFIKNDILSIYLKDPELRKCPEILINELSSNSRITEITSSSNLPNSITSAGQGYWDGKQPETVLTVFRAGIGENFLDFFNLKMISGRGFSSEYSSDTARSIIISQKTAKMLFQDDAVGKTFGFDPKSPGTIVGVVSDFNFQSLHHEIEPMALLPVGSGDFMEPEYIFAKVIPGALAETKTSIEEKLREISPHYLNPVAVLSDQVDDAYSSDRKLVEIFVFSTILAVVLTCLGQYSITSYTTKSRIKEMAVRKVLGSQPSGVLALLATEMVLWVIVSFVIAAPLAHILMARLLQNFAYQADIGAGVYLLSLLMILFVSLIAVGYHVLKVARVNPAEMIRHE